MSIRRAHRRRSRRVQRSEDDAVREVGVRGEKECAAEEVFRRRWEEMLRRRRHFVKSFLSKSTKSVVLERRHVLSCRRPLF